MSHIIWYMAGACVASLLLGAFIVWKLLYWQWQKHHAEIVALRSAVKAAREACDVTEGHRHSLLLQTRRLNSDLWIIVIGSLLMCACWLWLWWRGRRGA